MPSSASSVLIHLCASVSGVLRLSSLTLTSAPPTSTRIMQPIKSSLEADHFRAQSPPLPFRFTLAFHWGSKRCLMTPCLRSQAASISAVRPRSVNSSTGAFSVSRSSTADTWPRWRPCGARWPGRVSSRGLCFGIVGRLWSVVPS